MLLYGRECRNCDEIKNLSFPNLEELSDEELDDDDDDEADDEIGDGGESSLYLRRIGVGKRTRAPLSTYE